MAAWPAGHVVPCRPDPHRVMSGRASPLHIYICHMNPQPEWRPHPLRQMKPKMAHASATEPEEKTLGAPEECTQESEKTLSMHRKNPRKYLNKLGTPHILPKHFHPIFIIPLSRNNSQGYIPHIISLLNLR